MRLSWCDLIIGGFYVLDIGLGSANHLFGFPTSGFRHELTRMEGDQVLTPRRKGAKTQLKTKKQEDGSGCTSARAAEKWGSYTNLTNQHEFESNPGPNISWRD